MPFGAWETGVKRTTSAGGRVIGEAACGMGCILAQTSAISHQRQPITSNRYNQEEMSPAKAPSPLVRWLLVPVHVLLVAFLLALLTFAVCLFLGIFGLLITAAVRGVHPNMTVAYREIALPAAVVAGAIALLAAIVLEFRHLRQERSERSM